MNNKRSNILGHFQVLSKTPTQYMAGSFLMSKADANLADQPIMTKNAKKTMFCNSQQNTQKEITKVIEINLNGRICSARQAPAKNITIAIPITIVIPVEREAGRLNHRSARPQVRLSAKSNGPKRFRLGPCFLVYKILFSQGTGYGCEPDWPVW